MTLYAHTIGQGPDLVMLHGWGLHGGIFDDLAAGLSKQYRVTCIDLPGHGRSRDCLMPGNISAWAEAILAAAPTQAHWLGWSLGGLLLQYIALEYPQRCERLILTNATPKFLTGGNWTQAQTPAVLEQFADGLQQDYRATVNQFLALQVGPGATERQVLRKLRETVFVHGDPHPDGLMAGVEILRDTDLREDCKRILQPVQLVTGRLDRLTPPAAGDYLAQQLHQARLYQFDRSAHAPFLSHPSEFLDIVRDFLKH